MRGVMCGVCALWLVAAPLRLAAQDTTLPPPVDTLRPLDSTPVPVVRPPEPSADQLKYLRGLRTVARGVAQLRSGVDGVARAEGSRDTTRLRRAGRLLGGLCGTARTFMAQGRATMQPTVYEDSARVKARRLVLQIDSLIKAMPVCDTTASRAPARTAGTVLGRLRSYETALQEFRMTVATPAVVQAPAQP